jgi:hypothetical protein
MIMIPSLSHGFRIRGRERTVGRHSGPATVTGIRINDSELAPRAGPSHGGLGWSLSTRKGPALAPRSREFTARPPC